MKPYTSKHEKINLAKITIRKAIQLVKEINNMNENKKVMSTERLYEALNWLSISKE